MTTPSAPRTPLLLDDLARPNPVRLFGMMDGYRPITNLFGVADPNVHEIDGRWWMFLGGFQTNFTNNLFAARLPTGAALDSDDWEFVTVPGRPRSALPLVTPSPKGNWDAGGMHTPCYVAGDLPQPGGQELRCERIYYSGRRGHKFADNELPYSIGVLEKTADGWVRYPGPVVRGTPESPNALEPKVRFLEGKWRMWYATTPVVAGRKNPPVYRVCYTESRDGLTAWSPPQVVFDSDEGYFDAVVTAVDREYDMVVCRSSNLYGKPDFPDQGLWWLSSTEPTGDRSSWTPHPRLILDADNGADWYGHGIFGTWLCRDTRPGHEDVSHVFFTGVDRRHDWLRPALRRMRATRRPAMPAPFYFTVGRARFRRDPAGPARSDGN